jgi:acyl phosphate:glycerol-3-phosphate acyltransferase
MLTMARGFFYSLAVIRVLVFLLLAYLLGSVPVGLVLSRLKGRDPRTVGSGNIGATNVMRAVGKTLGIITLLGDAFKGFLPVVLALQYGLPPVLAAGIGFAAFIGHLFPIYLKFKGGKGVATALGVFLGLSPLAILIDFILFLGVFLGWGYVSLGSLVGVACMPLILLLLDTPLEYVALSGAIGILTFWKHKENIKRLRAGTESRLRKRAA